MRARQQPTRPSVPYFRLLRYTVPYLFALISVWVIVSLVPELALALLPNR